MSIKDDYAQPIEQGEQRKVKEKKPSDYIGEGFGYDIGNVDQGYSRSNCDTPKPHPGFLDGE